MKTIWKKSLVMLFVGLFAGATLAAGDMTTAPADTAKTTMQKKEKKACAKNCKSSCKKDCKKSCKK